MQFKVVAVLPVGMRRDRGEANILIVCCSIKQGRSYFTYEFLRT